jgi:transcriptional regulator with XRE-family HTH domain
VNAVNKFRESLGLTQAELARELGFSVGIISQWERGRIVSDAALEKLKTYAVQRDRADLAALFDPLPFTVKRVVLPPQRGSGIDPHSLLNEILQSDDQQAKLAVENFLFITTQYLRGSK